MRWGVVRFFFALPDVGVGVQVDYNVVHLRTSLV
jgi:hypothetical protein